MKNAFLILMFLFSMVTTYGCSAEFWGGTGAGILGTGAGYEIRAKQQLDELNEDYEAGNITKEEYEIRKDQIQKGSVVY